MPTAPSKPLLTNSLWAVVLLLVVVPVLYVLSLGPACWLTSQVTGHGVVESPRAMAIYAPLGALADDPDSSIGAWLRWWMRAGVKEGHSAIVPMSLDNRNRLILEP